MSGRNEMFNLSTSSKTNKRACQPWLGRSWRLIALCICTFLLVSWLSVKNAQRYRDPGFDYKLSKASTENLFTYHRSQHDIKKILDPPELRPTDGGWYAALNRFYLENISWLNRVVELHPSQAHPVFLSAYFAPSLLMGDEKGSYWYNLIQTFLFAITLILIGCISLRNFSKGPHLFLIYPFLFYLLVGDALTSNLKWGQTNIPVLFLASTGLLSISRGWLGVGGACIGLAAGDKIFPLLLIVAVPLKSWPKFLIGAATALSSVLLLLVSRCGIVAFADFLRWPFIAWHSNYNIITGGEGFWNYPPVNHSISHGIRAISVIFSVGSYYELFALSIFGMMPLVILLHKGVRANRSHTYSLAKVTHILSRLTELKLLTFFFLLSLSLPSYKREFIYCAMLYAVVEILRKFLTIKNCSYRILCVSGVILLVVFPTLFKLIYDHHLVFLIAGGWCLVVAIGGSVQSLSIRLGTSILLIVSTILCNLPYCTLPFGTTLAQFQPSCPTVGVLLATLVLYFWSRTKDFLDFAELTAKDHEANTTIQLHPEGCSEPSL